MKSKQRLAWVLVALMFVALGPAGLFAQDGENSGMPANVDYPGNPGVPGGPGGPPNAGNPSNDPPARVARIQYISGEVSLQPGGVNDWVAASLNRPLTSSDRVWTDKNSRAELNTGTAFLRMDSETSLTLTDVGNNTIQVELDQGTLEITVQHLEPGEIYEINTPNLAFTVMKSGVYRFDVRPSDNQTWVTVRKGNGQATGSGPAVKVGESQQVRFTGQGTLQHESYAAPSPDGFEDWAQVRDKRLDGAQSARYVAPGVIGYQDLDYYGRWQVVAPYGAIWVPTSVPVGWAPYRFGRWVWVAPWGWTWVDDAPWGFAPFHYGRWVSLGGFWGWAPGPVVVGWRPFYAPALVGWVGGAGWGFGVSFGAGFGFGGGFGWFPLGWGEPFYPWYHGFRGGFVSQTYIRNVNITNTHITNITNVTNNYYNNAINNTHYANRTVAGAVTAAPRSALANGQNIAKVGIAVPGSELGKGQVLRGVDVPPTRQAMLGGHTAGGSATPPRSAFDRSVVTQATPPARQASQPLDAHNVPQPPATLGARNPNTANAGQTHSVPRPPERNSAANTPPASGYNAQPGSTHVVPKPPYAGGPAPKSASSAEHNAAVQQGGHAAPSQEASRPSQQSGSPNHSEPSGGTKESKPKEAPRPSSGTASLNVPQPPAGNSYHEAPYASSRSPYGSHGSSAPAYRSSGSYSAAPTYTARAYTPAAPHYSAQSAPHPAAPSAPHYSGGSPAVHYSGGGSSGHSSSSGGRSGGHSR